VPLDWRVSYSPWPSSIEMTLARELLGSGQTVPVREYFSLCRRFWMSQFADAKLKEWDADVVAGREPRFGPHLRY
jgi:hypothetical protein